MADDMHRLLGMLEDPSPLRRSKAMEELRSSVKSSGGQLFFGANIRQLFAVLNARLRDSNWNVAHQCIQFLAELFGERAQELGPDFDECAGMILPTLVENLGDSKIVIRKASLSVLRGLALRPGGASAAAVLGAVVRGVEHDDKRVRQEALQSLSTLLTAETVGAVDMPRILDVLLARLRDESLVVVQSAEDAMGALRGVLRDGPMLALIRRMPSSKQALFSEHRASIMKEQALEITGNTEILVQFGCVPINTVTQLQDKSNWKVRAVAIEELLRTVQSLQHLGPVVPHLQAFVGWLTTLLTDPNFKISLTTLQIVGCMVETFGEHMRPCVPTMLPPLIEKLADNKIVVRQAILKVVKSLMRNLSPASCVNLLLANLSATNARIREEVINIVTVALITFPLSEFDVEVIVRNLVQAMGDAKPRVKSSAMGALTVLHDKIGGAMNTMLEALSEELYVELQTRFEQRHLPKINADGLVVHPNHPQTPHSQGSSSMGLTLEMGGLDRMFAEGSVGARDRRTPTGTPTSGKIPWDMPAGNSRSGPRISISTGSIMGSRGGSSGRQGSQGSSRRSSSRPDTYGSGSGSSGMGSRGGSSGMGGTVDDRYHPRSYGLEDCTYNAADYADERGDTSPSRHLTGGSPSRYPRSLPSSASSASGAGPSPSASPKPAAWRDASQVYASPKATTRQFAEAQGADGAVSPRARPMWLQSQGAPTSPEAAQSPQPPPSKMKWDDVPVGGQNHIIFGHSSGGSMPFDGAPRSDPATAPSSAASSSKPAMAGRRARSREAADDRQIGRQQHQSVHRADIGTEWGAESADLLSGQSQRFGGLGGTGRNPQLDNSAKLAMLKKSTNKGRQPGGATLGAAAPRNRTAPFGEGRDMGASADRRIGGGRAGASKAKSVVDINSRPVDITPTDKLGPLESPARNFKKAVRDLTSGPEEWSAQFEALDVVRKAAKHHPEVVSGVINSVVKDVLGLTDCLRSSVSRNAILCLRDMFTYLRGQMSSSLDAIVPKLIKRSSETNGFICQEADMTLDVMVQSTNPLRALNCLLSCADHRNPGCRAKTAIHINKIIQHEGRKVLEGPESDRLIPVLAKFLTDNTPGTRAAGKRSVFQLAQVTGDAEFEKLCRRLLSDANCRKVTEVIMQGRVSGEQSFGTMTIGHARPSRSRGGISGSRGRRAGESSADGDDGGAGADLSVSSIPRTRQGTGRSRQGAGRLSREMVPDIEALPSKYIAMTSGDWRERHKAVQHVVDVVLQYPAQITPSLVPIFDNLTLRLADGNLKVLQLALNSLAKLFPVLKERLELVLNTLVPAMAHNLGSSSSPIRDLTARLFDQLIDYVDGCALVQYFTNVIAFGNPRAKVIIVEKTTEIVESVHRQRPTLIVKHVLPRALRLLDDTRPEMRQPAHRLLSRLHSVLGEKLMLDPSLHLSQEHVDILRRIK